MIEKKSYLEKLYEVLEMAYPSKDYSKIRQRALDNRVHMAMTNYVLNKYHTEQGIEAKQLLMENKELLQECLTEIGITW